MKAKGELRDKCTCKPCTDGKHENCYRQSPHFGRCACMMRGHKRYTPNDFNVGQVIYTAKKNTPQT